MHKKVGTITLEYDRGDGVVMSEAFQGEFNNAIFNGDVSAMEGTFSGTLTANAINAVKNINIAGKTAALTYVSSRDRVVGIFDDDSIWREVHGLTFQIPASDTSGGWVSAGIQYDIDDQRDDNDQFPCQYRVLVDGAIVWTSPGSAKFGYFYRKVKTFFHEIVKRVSSPGYHTISLQYRWHDYNTNCYPDFRNIVIRADYIRK